MKINLIKCGIPSVIGSLAVLLGSGGCAIGKFCSLEANSPNDKSFYTNKRASTNVNNLNVNNVKAPFTHSTNSIKIFDLNLDDPSAYSNSNDHISNKLFNNVSSNITIHSLDFEQVKNKIKNNYDIKSTLESQEVALNSINDSTLALKTSLLAFIILSFFCVFSLKRGNNLFPINKCAKLLKKRIALELSVLISRLNNFSIMLKKIVYSKIKSLYHSAKNIGFSFIYRSSFSYVS